MAYVQIKSYTTQVLIGGTSTMNIHAAAANYTGTGAVYFRARLTVGGVSWNYPGRSADGQFSFAPYAGLLNGMTDSKTGVATLHVSMENEAGTQIGTPADAEVTLTASEALCAPQLSDGWVALQPANGGTPYPTGVYVKGSRLQAVFDLSRVDFRYGASAAEYANVRWKITAGGNSAETDGVIAKSDALTVVIPASGSLQVACRVKDSRGFTASQTFLVTAHEYAPPSLSAIQVYRCTSDGTASDTGAYIRAGAKAVIFGLGGENALTEFYAEYAPAGGGNAVRTSLLPENPALLGAGSISATRSYRVRICAVDSCMGTAEHIAIVSTADAAFNILPGGRGAAFGKYAEKENTLDAGDWDVETSGNLRAANLFPAGSVYMAGDGADPSALYGGTWEQVSTSLPFNVWKRTM